MAKGLRDESVDASWLIVCVTINQCSGLDCRLMKHKSKHLQALLLAYFPFKNNGTSRNLLKRLADFHTIWYEGYIVSSRLSFVTSDFLRSILIRYWTPECM